MQAVVEFTMGGAVITAKGNCVKTMGYTLEETKGWHHRMFCDAAYANNPEYQAFWIKLNRGKYDAET